MNTIDIAKNIKPGESQEVKTNEEISVITDDFRLQRCSVEILWQLKDFSS